MTWEDALADADRLNEAHHQHLVQRHAENDAAEVKSRFLPDIDSPPDYHPPADVQAADDAMLKEMTHFIQFPNRLKGIDYLDVRQPIEQLIDGYLLPRGLCQLYGAPYTGKTYVALDLSLSLCAGLGEWMGLKVNLDGPRHVVYVALEGGQPFWDAVEAWRDEHPGADLSGLHVLDAAEGGYLQISVDPKEQTAYSVSIDRLTKEINADDYMPTLIVIDTQIDLAPGIEENSAKEMNLLLGPLKNWAEGNKMLVMTVHHKGKTGNSPRGSSTQTAKFDVQIHLDPQSGLWFEKVKGAAKPLKPLTFEFYTVPIVGGSTRSACVRPSERQGGNGGGRIPDEVCDKILRAIISGCTSGRAIKVATNYDRDKVVKPALLQMESEDMIKNVGGKQPKYQALESGQVVPRPL